MREFATLRIRLYSYPVVTMARIAAFLLLIFVAHLDFSNAQDCYYDNGESYRGPTSTTVSGLTCQAWDQQTPHPHIFQPNLYPSAGLDGNFCRNPLGVDSKPWCYTTDPNVEFELCEVDECRGECYYGIGESYRGDATVTDSGLTCQAWDQQTPHTHIFRPTLYPDAGLEQNFCRNPLGVDTKPWCYTMDPAVEFETCQVNACPTTPAPPTTVDPNAPVGCPSTWSSGPRSCYLVVYDYRTWAQARDDCVSRGGHLATIGTYEDQTYIQQITNYDYQNYWIGLHDTGSEGTFIWVDGTPLTYTAWNSGEPSGSVHGDEDCVEMSGYTWNDNNCQLTNRYICEIDTGGAPTCGETLTDTEGVIESPGYPNEYGNSAFCAWVIENPDGSPVTIWFEHFDVECDYDFLTIKDGDDQHTYTCKLEAGFGCSYTTSGPNVRLEFTSDSSVAKPGFRLRYASVLSGATPPPIFPHQVWADRTCNATIEFASQFTQACLDGWTGGLSSCYLFADTTRPWATARVDCQRRGGDLVSINSDVEMNWIQGQTLGSGQYWIGLHDTGTEGTFVWSDRSPVTVTYWNTGEPNNAGNGEDCVETSYSNWNDAPCDTAYRYICEIRLEVTGIDCDFDTDVCGYTNVSEPNFYWTRRRGWTPQSNTGPLADHTTGIGYYMLTESSEPSQPGQTTTFTSQNIDVYTHSCLRFVYHIYDQNMGSLKVHVEGPRGKTTIYNSSGNNTNVWLKADIDVDAGSFRVVFEAIRGSGPTTNIAIDDVQLTEGFCIPCPSGWTATSSSCYKFVQLQKTWQEARDDCRSQGAALVSVNTAEEHTYLTSQVDTYYQPWYWIGLNDLGTEGSFTWSSGQSVTVTYWTPGEPNDSSANEDCVELQSSTWNDIWCGSQNYYICEISKDNPLIIDTSDGPIDEGPCYSGNGDKYRGTANTTVSGYDCQRWDQQRPHLHVYDAESYPEAGLEENYCRNPDGADRPWCYTTDPNVRWEYCDVQSCDGDTPTSAPVAGYDVRLVGGTSFGRVEVFYNGQWGTVCDDNFMKEDADVVCRELGFQAALQFYPDAYFEPGDGPIWLDEVGCVGTESSLQYCPNSGWGVHNCGHNEDVGVSCLE